MTEREIMDLAEIICDAGYDWNGYIENCHENGEEPYLSYDDFLAQYVLESGYRKEREERKPKTNADHIRAMSDEEIMDALRETAGITGQLACDVCCNHNCKAHNSEECKLFVLNWLKQPHKEG